MFTVYCLMDPCGLISNKDDDDDDDDDDENASLSQRSEGRAP